MLSAETSAAEKTGVEMADPKNPFHIASPSNGDLWVMYVNPGDIVKKGEEVFNVTVMKMEMAVTSPADGMVKRVLKSADYNMDKKMVPVREGELLVELGPIPKKCKACSVPVPGEDYKFCPSCGIELGG